MVIYKNQALKQARINAQNKFQIENYKNVKEFYKSYLKLSLIYNV